MGQIIKEIENAIKSLNLSSADIKHLNDEAGEVVFYDCLQHFVASGDRRWWWEDFKYPSFSFVDLDKPFLYLEELIPETDDNVWLIIEDNYENFYPVYDANPKVISKIIGECFAFEYYIISKSKDWLLCENHHNRLIGIGDKLKSITKAL